MILVCFCRVSPKTLLTFCTSGVLLRTLMSGDDALSTVTHVIVVSVFPDHVDVKSFPRS